MQKDPEKDSLVPLVLADRRYAAMLGLGFSAGIPYLLLYVTQSAWLSEAKVPIETIGLMSELTIAYKFKFVWAPFLDKYDVPIFSALLGRRRGWIVVSQLAIMLALRLIGWATPWLSRSRSACELKRASLSADVDHIVAVKLWETLAPTQDSDEDGDELTLMADDLSTTINALGNCCLLEKSCSRPYRASPPGIAARTRATGIAAKA